MTYIILQYNLLFGNKKIYRVILEISCKSCKSE